MSSLSSVIAERPEPCGLRIVFSAIGYMLRPTIDYVIYLLSTNEPFKNRFNIVLFALLPLNTLTAFSAFWTDAAYTYDAANQFIRGPLGYTSQLLSCLYLFIAVYYHIINMHNKFRLEYIVLIGSVFVICFGFFVEARFNICGIGQMSMVFTTMV